MKVQKYSTLTGFMEKTENFLLKNEVSNNLFWEALRGLLLRSSQPAWFGTIMNNGQIELCGIRTSSNYLLLSCGKKSSIDHLIKYTKAKKWKLNGVSGPEKSSLFFANQWLHGQPDEEEGRRDFLIFESPGRTSRWKGKVEDKHILKIVGDKEWPRARLWALQFAIESTPKLNGAAVVAMAKEMKKKKSLFFLLNNQMQTCGMAGFGRETPSFNVINLVYVPKEFRKQKIAQRLILELIRLSRETKKKKCILFSDYLKVGNLYESIGFKLISTYSERKFK